MRYAGLPYGIDFICSCQGPMGLDMGGLARQKIGNVPAGVLSVGTTARGRSALGYTARPAGCRRVDDAGRLMQGSNGIRRPRVELTMLVNFGRSWTFAIRKVSNPGQSGTTIKIPLAAGRRSSIVGKWAHQHQPANLYEMVVRAVEMANATPRADLPRVTIESCSTNGSRRTAQGAARAAVAAVAIRSRNCRAQLWRRRIRVTRIGRDIARRHERRRIGRTGYRFGGGNASERRALPKDHCMHQGFEVNQLCASRPGAGVRSRSHGIRRTRARRRQCRVIDESRSTTRWTSEYAAALFLAGACDVHAASLSKPAHVRWQRGAAANAVRNEGALDDGTKNCSRATLAVVEARARRAFIRCACRRGETLPADTITSTRPRCTVVESQAPAHQAASICDADRAGQGWALRWADAGASRPTGRRADGAGAFLYNPRFVPGIARMKACDPDRHYNNRGIADARRQLAFTDGIGARTRQLFGETINGSLEEW